MSDHWNRRQVLRYLGATGIASVGSGRVAMTARGASPNDRLNLAIIGCGGQGAENLDKVAGENIVALCDVDEQRAADAFRRYPKAKRFHDYRKLLDALHQQIDAVVVSIPDHMHAPVSLTAMELGKHVYCEKPLTWSIDEARRMARLASEKKLATQMGTQGMAGDGARTGIEVIRSGVLGAVTELHVWTDRPAGWWPQGIDRPRDTPPVPSSLDWNLWLGVASARPYHPAYCPFTWRGWKDFGTGAVGDMAPRPSQPRAPGQSHHQEWLAACRGGAGLLPLRWIRFPTDRDHARGQPRAANRPEDPLECRSHAGSGLPRGVPLHQT